MGVNPVNIISQCQYHESMSIPWALTITQVNVYTLGPKIQITEWQKTKYWKTDLQIKEKLISEIPKYK